MRLTFFGLTLSSSWGNGHATPYRALLRALHTLGHKVTFFEQEAPYYARHRDLPEPDFCRLIIYPDWEAVRPTALRVANASDVVVTASFLQEGARINDALQGLRGPLRVYYDLDTPVTLARLASDEPVDYVRADQFAAFDRVLSFVGGPTLDLLRREYGARAVSALYGCVDLDRHRRVPVPAGMRCALSYMGTHADDRWAKLNELFLLTAAVLPRERFLLAGSMYPPDLALPGNVQRYFHVSPGDHSALYSASQLTLNLTRAEMAAAGYCPSGRFFESAACGTPVITDVWAGLGEFFHPGTEVLVAADSLDVQQALLLPGTELAAIGARARERTLDEHTGTVRARQFLQALEQLPREAAA